MTLEPSTPAEGSIASLQGGGLSLTLRVPGYGGWAEFTLTAERAEDGDWRVWIPWSKDLPELVLLENRTEVVNGVAYLSAPDPLPICTVCENSTVWDKRFGKWFHTDEKYDHNHAALPLESGDPA